MKVMKKIFFVFVASLAFAHPLSGQEYNWQINGVMQNPVAGGAALVIDEYIYIVGGYSRTEQEPVNWIQRFNPNTYQWEIVDSISSPRYGLLADYYNQSIYYSGGIQSDTESLFNLEKWSSIEDSFTSFVASHSSFNRTFATGGIVEDKFYMFGGSSFLFADSLQVPYLSVFDLEEGFVEYEIDTLYNSYYLPQQQMSFNDDELIYIFGGITNGVQDKIVLFDTESREFVTLPKSMPYPVAGGCAVYDEEQEAVLIIGGFHENLTAINQTTYFSVEDTTVIPFSGPDLQVPRRNAMAVNYYGSIYVFGGFDLSGQVVATFETLEQVNTTASLDEVAHNFEYELYQNYPNPFNPSTNIKFEIKSDSHVRIDVLNILGQRINTLVDDIIQPGVHSVSWEGTDEKGKSVSAGTYFYVMTLPGERISKKMILLR